jgi:hypothetical protein
LKNKSEPVYGAFPETSPYPHDLFDENLLAIGNDIKALYEEFRSENKIYSNHKVMRHIETGGSRFARASPESCSSLVRAQTPLTRPDVLSLYWIN